MTVYGYVLTWVGVPLLTAWCLAFSVAVLIDAVKSYGRI